MPNSSDECEEQEYCTKYCPEYSNEITKFSNNSIEIIKKYGKVTQAINEKYDFNNIENMPSVENDFFSEIFDKLIEDPDKILEYQMDYTANYVKLINNSINNFLTNQENNLYEPEKNDKRFSDHGWNNNVFFDFLKQSHLMTGNWVKEVIQDLTKNEIISSETSSQAQFFSKLTINAMSPSNFLATNPEVLRKTLETNGENLIKGLENLYRDIINSDDQSFQIQTNDVNAFEIGKNIACTKGKVIYQNELMQLISYSPSTKQQYEIPILITPPWINKYYIFDLQQSNSFVKWLTDQGFSVFMISWVNPGVELSEINFEDYMEKGVVKALEVIRKYKKCKKVNSIGYCIGGILLSCSISYLTSRNKEYVNNATFLTTLVDFQNAGDLSMLANDKMLLNVKKKLSQDGFFDGKNMSLVFNMLKSNEMIWSFFINNYLLGKDSKEFDMLFWNSDPSRLPAKMYEFYVENMYNKNLLKENGGISLKNTPINLQEIEIDSYFLAAKSDHIVPWESSFDGLKYFSGNKKFVLSASGHVAGVINHPNQDKYCYWLNDNNDETNSSKWLQNAQKHDGSWWKDWLNWVNVRSGSMKNIYTNDKSFPEIEKAPGSYIKMK